MKLLVNCKLFFLTHQILSPIKDGIVSDWDLETDGRRSGVVLEMAEEEDATAKRS